MPKFYSRPDLLADNLELRRLVSSGSKIDRTDFYEFYWAHLMPTSTWSRLVSWFWILMWRRGQDVPKPLKPLWVISWVVAIAVFFSGSSETIRLLFGSNVESHTAWTVPWLVILVGTGISLLVRSYAGDAAVYLSPRPENIEARQKIRAAGLALLDKLAKSKRYDRIIVVGHSLGSVIGYDILTFAWQRHMNGVRTGINEKWKLGEFPPRARDAIQKAEQLAMEIAKKKNPTVEEMKKHAEEWQAETRAVDLEQRSNDAGWLVTDFVTLGCPLTYSSMLLAKDVKDFHQRAEERELPLCPPVLENDQYFSFDHRNKEDQTLQKDVTVLNDAAVFAVVAWTNLYFPSRYVFKGDIIGGPIAPLMPGVRDLIVKTHKWSGWISHTNYWEFNELDKDQSIAPLDQLRAALDLNRNHAIPGAQKAPKAASTTAQPTNAAPAGSAAPAPPKVGAQELNKNAD
ncbi:hypothetical protein ACYZUC_05055 [Pseudomonas sp. GT1P32]